MGNSVQRWMQNLFKIEYCTVVEVDRFGRPGVQCHSPDHPEYYNTVTVKVRDAKKNIDPKKLQHVYEIVIQDFTGNCFGHPWTPRVGDLVLVLFLYNTQPIILGPVNTTYQTPPFRAPTSQDAMYDEVWKWCQWLRPTEDKNMDYKDHPQGKMPICRKLFHGPVTGAAGGKGRDEMFIWDCQMGDAEPTCRLCEIIDSVPRSGEQWFKQYSTKTESEEAYNSRAEWHSRCGSYLRLESDDENPAGTSSSEYSEGIGHIRFGNAISENSKRGHINFRGNESSTDHAGTIDIHAEHEEASFESESQGARISVVANSDDSVDFATKMEYFDKNSFIEILKNGNITLSSLSGMSSIWIDGTTKTITLNGIDYIDEIASEEIELNTPLVHITGNLVVDGSLTHGGGSCCGGGWSE
ncbi:hypothetical protein [Bacteroides sp.]|uniref:hypothetical protein n=1 Tax=Bacteroides sp. TaxID=29523 RepID=UPI0026111615|nr:hypothetical protein [Bacteroides sp.]MDD3040722.1 hypothetical protein [Bacteroides sp.]